MGAMAPTVLGVEGGSAPSGGQETVVTHTDRFGFDDPEASPLPEAEEW